MTSASERFTLVAHTAIAAITGQTLAGTTELIDTSTAPHSDTTPAEKTSIDRAVELLCTRIGLAPALARDERDELTTELRALSAGEPPGLLRSEVHAWEEILRNTPEQVPTLEREPVALPDMPLHLQQMWETLLDFEEAGPPPWVLVGGQMTALHLLEHNVTVYRPTDDGDVVVGVWTRRNALRNTTTFLTDAGFSEQRTGDGYGYRFTRGKTTIDVLIPEGLERQRRYPTTSTGQPGLTAEGGNQALTRAQRVPIVVAGRSGHVRRPTLLGALVAKAHAWVVDSRDAERHLQDLVALAGLALLNPRDTLQQARPDDSRVIRAVLRTLKPGHRLFRAADDPDGVQGFLLRLGTPRS